MIAFDDGAGFAQRRFFRQLFHRQDRAHRNIQRIADLHDFVLGPGLSPLLDRAEDFIQVRQARRWRRVVGVLFPLRLADDVADFLPDRGLGDEISVSVGIGFPALALQDAARLAAARIVAGARRGFTEGNAFAVLRVFPQRAGLETLLVAQLDPAQVQHAILHRRQHALPAAGFLAMDERGANAESEMQAGARIADLGPRHQRQAVAEPGGRGRAAGALRYVLVYLAVFVRPGSETLDRGHDHARVQFLDALPAEAHAIERAGREILHQHVTGLDQAFEHFLAFRRFRVQRQRALVVIEHGEIQAVGAFHVDQLFARGVADAGTFHLDHVRTHPREQLGTGGS